MRLHLTDASVRSLKPTTKQEKHWDTKTRGFGIRVNGHTKTWIVMYGVKRTLKTLGRYPDVTLAAARQQALTYLATKPEVIVSPKFEPTIKLFLDEHYADKAPRWKLQVTRLLGHFTAFNALSVADITDQQVAAELTKLTDTPSEKLHAFRAIRTFFRWCVRPPRRYLTRNPLEGYEPPGKDKKGTRMLSDTELVKVWNASTDRFGILIKLIMLWGTRGGETGRLQRPWLKDDVLTIPGEYTKNGRAHAIPILPLAKSLLESLPDEGIYYFPGKTPGTHLNDGSWGKLKKQLDERTGINEPWQVRDLRRTFRSNMPRLKVPRSICELLVNHASEDRTVLDEIYDKYDYLDEKREALLKHEQFIQQLLAA